MLSEERKVKKMGNVSTKNSQAGTVYSPGGGSPTICAGTHGYAIGYIVVKNFPSGRNNRRKQMTYGFICPNCGRKENITMPITQYTSEGHLCPECNTEMQRDISTMGCMSIDKTGDFYRRVN